ncbi:MAG TPA: DUF4911 domain-containing protein [Polyangiaceae bacterium]|nr:DUF4911 domain-containing protein [Polyangiaceae bacterium]
MVSRRVVIRGRDVVYFKAIIEASDGLAGVFAMHGGDLVVAAPADRCAELDAILDDLALELGVLKLEP